jgi:Peptidase A4 family
MKNASLVLALLVAAAPLAALAEQSNELPTNLPGIRTIAAPPEGFDALTATDADLAYYGFPPRPNDNSGDYASWAKAMAATQERIVPVLEQTNIYHGPARKAPNPDATTYGSYNWSGAVQTNSAKKYGKSSYDFVYSDVTVPKAEQANGKCTGGWDYGVAWVGIDGFNNADVLQDGIEFDAYCNKGAKASFYSAWFEWAPLSEVRISNMPIAPGEEFFIEIWSTSDTVGHALLTNITKKKGVLIVFDAPKGTKLVGSSAEWITERPEVNGALATLTNYGSQKYSDAHGETFSGKALDPGDSSPIVMVDNKGKPISYPTLDSATSFTVKDEGSAK